MSGTIVYFLSETGAELYLWANQDYSPYVK